ncbi:MAG: hypothetical protein ACOY3Y_12685 [Acidobacteriota bacterium]
MSKNPRSTTINGLGVACAAIVISLAATAGAAPPLPDLTVNLAVPANAVAGEDIGPRVTLRVKNVGRAPAWGTTDHPTGYMVDLTLGRDEVVPPGFAGFSPHFREDVLLKGGRVSNTVDLPPGAFRGYPVGAGIPNDTPPGRYFVCARVDPGSAVNESNENNNVTCRPIGVVQRLNVGPQDDLPGIKPPEGE